MYKIIFADDESIMRSSISTLIDWNKAGFELVSCAANGDELIDNVSKHNPDLVISDINMPFVDGITAGKEIRRANPHVKLIFLTGYNELSYVHEAINLKVFRYLLKPITPESLYEVLANVKISLDEEITNRKNQTKLKKYYDSSYLVLQSLYLKSLIKDSEEAYFDGALSEILSLDGLTDSSLTVSLIGIGEGSKKVIEESEDFNIKALLNISLEMLNDEKLGYAILDGKRILLLFCLDKNLADEDAAEKIELALESIMASTKSLFKMDIYVGVGESVVQYTKLKSSYEEAEMALLYAEGNKLNAIVSEKDIRKSKFKEKISNNPFLVFADEINFRSKKWLADHLDKLDNQFKNVEVKLIKLYFVDALLQLVKKADLLGIDDEELIYAITTIQTKHYSQNKDLITAFQKTLFIFKDHLEQSNQNNSKLILQSAIRFVEEHYMDPNLGIKEVCANIHLSESYFRSIFKQESGKTFGNFLTSYRMEKAKELILSSNLKNYQIADEVGYSDPHYFSYCFKKYFGVSPKQFKAQAETDRV